MMPRHLSKYFKNIEVLTFKDADLVEIHEIDLASFTKLTHLDLSSNLIEVIEENLLKSNENLEKIDLNNNKIKFVHPGVFDHLKNLKYLDFKENQCDSNLLRSLEPLKDVTSTLSTSCNDDFANIKTQLRKSNYESQFRLQIMLEKIQKKLKTSQTPPLDDDRNDLILQIEARNRKFVTDTNLFMTALGISVIGIVFYLAMPFYKKLSETPKDIDENYERFKDDTDKGKNFEVPKTPISPEKAEIYGEPFNWDYDGGENVPAYEEINDKK